LFGEPKLTIAGRDRTGLVDGLRKQVVAVEAAVAGVGQAAPVHGCFCFIAPAGLLADVGFPLPRTLSIGDFPLLYPRRLARRLTAPGPVAAHQAQLIHAHLARRLPPA
jgi:hypothetical protein